MQPNSNTTISSGKEEKKTYMSFHSRIRNDEHPDCRKYHISFHSSLKEAVNRTMNENDDSDIDDDNYIKKRKYPLKKSHRERLENGLDVWINEWIRRCNGDRYKVFTLSEDETYDVTESSPFYYINSDDDDDSDDSDNDSNECNDMGINLQYMLFHVYVDDSMQCPSDIKYEISFYKTLSKAYEILNKYLYYLDQKLVKQDDNNLPQIFVKSEYHRSDSASGDYYQIILLKYNERMCLDALHTAIMIQHYPIQIIQN